MNKPIAMQYGTTILLIVRPDNGRVNRGASPGPTSRQGQPVPAWVDRERRFLW